MSKSARPTLVLDFDGVIARPIPLLSGIERLDPAAVKRLGRIVQQTNAQIVVSSSWRYDAVKKVGCQCHILRAWLAHHGCLADLVGETPTLPSDVRRVEIGRYLWGMRPMPRAIAILEDDHYMGPLTPWTVQPDYRRLMTDEDAEKVIRLLKARGRGARPVRRILPVT
jgi:hypothetical protein